MSQASKEIKKYAGDWITAGVVAGVFTLYLELAPAHARQFQINDPKISHSFANPQIINDTKLYLLVFVIPVLILTIVSYLKAGTRFVKTAHLSILGLFLSFVLTGFLTDLLKIWISRPRPDFMSRCLPKEGTPLDKYVSLEVCTQTSYFLLNDGLKSCPSGHSSLSMSGALFLCLWLNGQFKLFNSNKPLWMQLSSWSYVLVALFVAISRHIDYRHHVEDILLGLLIGGSCSYYVYFRYFPALGSSESDLSLDEVSVLPK
ncbi:phosphatidate phosphatase [Yamadazyma tenuis]|uniref:Diacylglycerol pyrophosphate phosphatase n=1 Tax=Candida tenuis (strain ATCC 10573 / BCRC 21748 / CBS 615 / JCM 9827 / NBRC 10315 / NRRL Y-1498 / VKM Y-70) TaxID=590646 RepID=G3B0K5_CANTC|nr:diacylglycerol pyrophosphate phosphatase [Yamadazyma tenuis ATCC 10573]EGV65416.1 diacylglycerol pyrophosphate phosphatase [Yamadazyma tenuis ATCC 10573]WEJ94904.1 phosphatidate phosphatase [Yamadazyma tenuis]